MYQNALSQIQGDFLGCGERAFDRKGVNLALDLSMYTQLLRITF